MIIYATISLCKLSVTLCQLIIFNYHTTFSQDNKHCYYRHIIMQFVPNKYFYFICCSSMKSPTLTTVVNGSHKTLYIAVRLRRFLVAFSDRPLFMYTWFVLLQTIDSLEKVTKPNLKKKLTGELSIPILGYSA